MRTSTNSVGPISQPTCGGSKQIQNKALYELASKELISILNPKREQTPESQA